MLKDPLFYRPETQENAEFLVKIFSFVALWIPAIRLISIFIQTVLGQLSGSILLPILTALAAIAAIFTFRQARQNLDERSTRNAIIATIAFGILNFCTSAVNAGSGVFTVLVLLVISGAFYYWICMRYIEANELLFSLKRGSPLGSLSP